MNNVFSQLFDSPLVDALGWTVLHSLWQGALLLLFLQVVFRLLKQLSAAQKYRWAYAVLCLQFLAAVLTFFLVYERAPSVIVDGNMALLPDVFSAASPASVSFSDNFLQINHFLTASLPIISSVWLVGMLFFLLRLVAACYYWEQLRRNYLGAVPESWQKVLDRLIVQMNVHRAVELKCSEGVSSPLLVGQFRPLILLPVAMVNQLTIQEVEAILAHELAHLRRYDFVLNVIQLLIEAIFYYHPANWWIGKQIRTYRELASDDLAIGQTGEALVYAKALLTLAEQPVVSTKFKSNTFALGWLGGQKEELLTRIKRILNQPDKQSEMREKFAVTSLLVLLALGISLGAGWPDSPELESELATSIEVLLPAVDTLPPGTIRLKTEDNGESMEVMIKDQAIQELSINGEAIPPTEFPKYQTRVEKMIADVPPPPPPPPAPAAPAPPSPPSGIPVPPPPPPAPGVEEGRRYIIHERTIEKSEEGGEERTIVVEVDDNGGEHVWVDEKDGEIIVKVIDSNGEEDVQIIKIGEEMSTEMEEYIIKVEADEEARIIEVEKIVEESMEYVEKEMERVEIEMERVEKEMEEVEMRIKVINAGELDQVIEIQEEIHRGPGDDWLGQQLVADGLTESASNFNFKLNMDRLKVNGRTQSSEMHERYMKLYESHSGNPFTEKTNINIVKKMR